MIVPAIYEFASNPEPEVGIKGGTMKQLFVLIAIIALFIKGASVYNASQMLEPATMMMLGAGLIGLAVLARKRLFKKP